MRFIQNLACLFGAAGVGTFVSMHEYGYASFLFCCLIAMVGDEIARKIK